MSSTLATCAGFKELVINIFGSLLHSTTSIFSPCNSLTILCILIPLNPTQDPTASIPSCFATTETLLLLPASLAIDMISTEPFEISGTSCSNNFCNKIVSALDTINSGPLGVSAIFFNKTLNFCPTLYLSEYICSLTGNKASALPISTNTFF